MTTSWAMRKRSSASNLVIPESEVSRRVSLTGYSNIIIDESNTSKVSSDEDKERVRVHFATLPSVEMGMTGINGEHHKRKYSVALQTLKPFRPSSKDGKLPINKVGFFSYIFMTWFSPLVWKMFRKRTEPVVESDIWECSDKEGVRENTERLLRLWNDELDSKGPDKASFLSVWKQFIRTRVLVSLLFITLMAVSSFLSSAFLVNMIIQYLESPDDSLIYGLGLTASVLVCEVIRACTFSNLMVFGAQTGTRFRSGFIGLMYDKLLRMKTMKGKTSSEILNIFSVDSYRVYISSSIVGFLLAVPIYLIIGTVYCYTLIGLWCFVPICSFVVCYMGMMSLTRVLQSIRRLCSQYTDRRVKQMGEILNSMKFIKMYAWEQAFTDAIKGIRNIEQKFLLYSNLVNAVSGSIIPVTPTIASVITITVYTAAGNSLTAATAFAVIGTMNFLRVIVSLIPFAMRAYGESKVSFDRMKKLLLMEEYQEPSTECFDKKNDVEIKAAHFVWDVPLNTNNDMQIKLAKKRRKASVSSIASSRRESVNLFALTDMDLEVKRIENSIPWDNCFHEPRSGLNSYPSQRNFLSELQNQGLLIGICGSVGSGKSSLMSAVLGRMPMMKGHLAVNGCVAYVAQQAWIFNGSLRENILFGREYDPDRYQAVIRTCGLEPDIRILTDGDETEIGERGANLSGGQKQRVNLARAVYSDSDIYILDDPLSAVDVRVGKQLFHECIQGHLKDKTVLLVTHQLQYLKHCDEVVVMDEGTIVEKGSHEDLLKNNGLYEDMFKIFESTVMKPGKKKDVDHKDAAQNQKPSFVKKKESLAAVSTNGLLANGQTKDSKKKKKKQKLVLAEEASIGSISFSTYSSYIQAAGGWLVAIVVLFMYFVAAGSLVFSDWWLSEWINSLTSSSSSTPLPANKTWQSTSLSNTTTTNATTQSLTFSLSNSTVYDGNSTATVYASSNLSYDTYFMVYILSLAGILVLQLSKGFAGAKATMVASNRLNAKCLDKVMKAPMSFFDSTPAGRILNRFSKDLDEGDVFIPQVINSCLQILTLVILSTAMSAYITPWILIAVVPFVGVFYLMKEISTVSIRQLKRLENITRSPLISHVNVTSQGLPTIVAYRQQGRFFDKCMDLGDVASTAIFLFDVSMRWIGLRLDLVAGTMTVGTALIFVITKGLIPPASAGLVLGLCGKTVSIVQFLVRLMNEAEARFTSIERLHEYGKGLASEPQHAKKMAPTKWPSDGEVTFRDVVMRYRPEMDPVLRKVSFSILPREKVGVVGRTGAGKSSLAAVLFRLVELSGGTIFVDKEDISQLHLSEIRSKISTIPQEPVLFDGTLRYNIDPFSLYSDDDIWVAIEKVHMKEKIVQFDEGLEVIIDENGENFSIGERQLICLARAVLRSSKILLLDEATANIDTSTDAMIQQTIRDCFSDCTVITIAHRLNTVLHSDKIIVMDSGQILIIAQGNHLNTVLYRDQVTAMYYEQVMECASPQDLLSNPHSFFSSMIAAQSIKTPSP